MHYLGQATLRIWRCDREDSTGILSEIISCSNTHTPFMMAGTSLIDANGTANLFISSQMPRLWAQAWQQFSLTAPFLDNSAPPHWPQTLHQQPWGTQ